MINIFFEKDVMHNGSVYVNRYYGMLTTLCQVNGKIRELALPD